MNFNLTSDEIEYLTKTPLNLLSDVEFRLFIEYLKEQRKAKK